MHFFNLVIFLTEVYYIIYHIIMVKKIDAVFMFSEKVTTFIDSISSLETRDDVSEWLNLFLEKFRLLSSDVCQANMQLSSRVNDAEQRLSAVKSELKVQKAITPALQEV